MRKVTKFKFVNPNTELKPEPKTPSDVIKELKEKQERIKLLEKHNIEQTKNLNELSGEFSSKQRELNTIKSKIESTTSTIKYNNEEIDDLKREIETTIIEAS